MQLFLLSLHSSVGVSGWAELIRIPKAVHAGSEVELLEFTRRDF